MLCADDSHLKSTAARTKGRMLFRNLSLLLDEKIFPFTWGLATYLKRWRNNWSSHRVSEDVARTSGTGHIDLTPLASSLWSSSCVAAFAAACEMEKIRIMPSFQVVRLSQLNDSDSCDTLKITGQSFNTWQPEERDAPARGPRCSLRVHGGRNKGNYTNNWWGICIAGYVIVLHIHQ